MHAKRPRIRRRGLSILEFIGCLIALAGGVWLGAICLGIDVQHLAYVALSESSLIERMPEQWRPAEPAPPEGAPTRAQLAEQAQQELASLQQEIKTLRNSPQTSGPAPATTPGSDEAEGAQLAKQQTLAYWNQIYDIVRSEAALQRDAESAASQSNATQVAALKARISRHSATAIRALATQDVDPTAVAVAKDLANWYDDGANLYDQAVQIWESASRGKSGPKVTEDWDRARIQHRNEGQLLDGRISAARDSLVRRYGDGFAEISRQ